MKSLTEPVRKSVLDVVQYNLRAAGCVSFTILLFNIQMIIENF